MKAIIKFKGILLVSLFALACATAPFKVQEKYNFDNKLQEATDISNFRIDSWEPIDHQSLVIKTDINNYYLVILDRPAIALPSSENIGVTITVDKIRPGFDQIIVADKNSSESYTIYKIYKLDGRKQATEIKKNLKAK